MNVLIWGNSEEMMYNGCGHVICILCGANEEHEGNWETDANEADEANRQSVLEMV